MRVLLFLIAFASAIGERSVGVCWTRSAVAYNPNKLPDYGIDLSHFEEVVASLLTIRRGVPGLKTCLFTEASDRAVSYAINALLKEQYYRSLHWPGGEKVDRVAFDFVLPSADGTQAAVAVLGKERAVAMQNILQKNKAHRTGSLWTKAHALVARLANLANSPFDITLFLDTDTGLCPSTTLPELLEMLGAGATLRLAELPAAKGKLSALQANSQAETRHLECMHQIKSCSHCSTSKGWNTETDLICTNCSLRCESARGLAEPYCRTFADQPPSLQVGAMIVTKSTALSLLVNDWIRAYFNVFSATDANSSIPLDDVFGNDQVPLNRIVGNLCSKKHRPENTSFIIKQLSPGFNFRAFAEDAKFLVSGRVVVLHSHGLHGYEHKTNGGIVAAVKRVCGHLNPPRSLGLRTVYHGLYKDPDHISVHIEPFSLPNNETSVKRHSFKK